MPTNKTELLLLVERYFARRFHQTVYLLNQLSSDLDRYTWYNVNSSSYKKIFTLQDGRPYLPRTRRRSHSMSQNICSNMSQSTWLGPRPQSLTRGSSGLGWRGTRRATRCSWRATPSLSSITSSSITGGCRNGRLGHTGDRCSICSTTDSSEDSPRSWPLDTTSKWWQAGGKLKTSFVRKFNQF